MAQKKLQLSEIKVKSFVTLVDKTEQKTSKGGYKHIHMKKDFSEIIGISLEIGWTEYKTRLADEAPGEVFLSNGGRSKGIL